MKNMYRFEIVGYGFERVYASLDKKKYKYWKNNNLNDLIEKTHLVEKYGEYLLFKDADWSSFDDLGHFEGARFDEDSQLVVYDEKNKEIYRTELGEWNLDDENQELIDADEFYLSSLDDCKYVFIAESTLTGCFHVGQHKIVKFDIHKIGFNTVDVNGDVIVIGLKYDGEEVASITNDLTVESLELKVEEL
jgi:hypothetical protein